MLALVVLGQLRTSVIPTVLCNILTYTVIYGEINVKIKQIIV